VFTNNNPAIFDDTASTGLVNLATTVTPTAITFSNSTSTYTLTGPGKITGSLASMDVEGAGTVILDESGGNDFSGGITINHGTLQVGNSDAAGTLGNNTVANNSALVFKRLDA